jgi:site-specific recombinase XerD
MIAQGWLLDGDLRQLSQQTRAARKLLIEKLLWFLRTHGHPECGTAEIRAFLAYISTGHEREGGRWGNPLLKKAVRPRTVHTYYGNLRTFFRWLVAEGELLVSPMETIRAPVARADQIQPFTEQQASALLAAARRTRHPRRDEAILLFLLDTGARASELCALRMRDLDLAGRRCTVLGKGNKRRTLYLNPATVRALWAYLREEPHGEDDPLFISDGVRGEGGAFTRSGLQQLMERLGRAAKVEAVRCTPHTFRHTFAVSFIRNGGSAFSLMGMLGHTSLHMSNRYVALAEADLESQHQRFSPVATMKNARR